MAENGGSKEDKFDAFTSAGETLGYISLEQARVLAMRHARDNTDFYGTAYSRVSLVWEVISEEEGEDYYDVRLSFRPAGRFRGEPGVEQFIIDKTGSIEIRQILDEPSGLGRWARRRTRLLLPSAVGLVIVAVVAAGVVFASGVLGGGGPRAAIQPATATPGPTEAPAVKPTATPVPAATPTGRTVVAPTRGVITGPTPSPINPDTISLADLKQALIKEITAATPGLSPDRVAELVSGALLEAEATGRSRFSLDEVEQYVTRALEKPRGIAGGPAPTETLLVKALITGRLLLDGKPISQSTRERPLFRS